MAELDAKKLAKCLKEGGKKGVRFPPPPAPRAPPPAASPPPPPFPVFPGVAARSCGPGGGAPGGAAPHGAPAAAFAPRAARG